GRCAVRRPPGSEREGRRLGDPSSLCALLGKHAIALLGPLSHASESRQVRDSRLTQHSRNVGTMAVWWGYSPTATPPDGVASRGHLALVGRCCENDCVNDDELTLQDLRPLDPDWDAVPPDLAEHNLQRVNITYCDHDRDDVVRETATLVIVPS